MKRKNRPREHIFIPDTQIREGVNTDHLEAVGNYIVDKRPDVIVQIGDWWDMPSLLSVEYAGRGSKHFEGKRYSQDCDVGNAAMARLMKPIRKAMSRGYKPRLVYTRGNHEQRIERAIEAEPKLEGLMGYGHHDLHQWEVHDFLVPVVIDGVAYCHYFVNPQSAMKRELSGNVDNRLNRLKHSFSQGHQQTLAWGTQFVAGGRQLCGLVAGSFYSHDEEYLGPQGNAYWRGCVYKHEVKDGRYDPMMLSLDYLVREWL